MKDFSLGILAAEIRVITPKNIRLPVRKMKKFVGNPFFQLLAGTASIVSLCYLFINDWLVIFIISFFVVTLIAMYNFYMYLKQKYSRYYEVVLCKQKQINNIYNEATVNLIVKDKEYKRRIEKENADIKDYLEMLQNLQYELYNQLSEITITLLNELNFLRNIHDSICVTIKHIFSHKDSNEVKICTIWRDSASYHDGRKAGKSTIQDLYKNSDFMNIYNSHADGSHYFLSNDLKKEQNYHNSSSEWSKFYNATLVVPIEIPRRKEGIIGFLCADSLNKLSEKFFTEEHVKILCSISSLLASYNHLMETLSKDIIHNYYANNSQYKQIINEVLL